MEEFERRARPRHAPVVAAHMEKRWHVAAHDKSAQHERVMPLGRGEDGEDFARSAGRRGEIGLEHRHAERGLKRKPLTRRSTSLSRAGGGSSRPLIQS